MAVGEGRAVGRSPAQSPPWVEGMAPMARGADSKWAQKTPDSPGGGGQGRAAGTGGTDRGARVGGWRFTGWGQGAQEQGEA